ncbi:MAG: DUF4258 domain-containing protein [Kovacikia sp.]
MIDNEPNELLFTTQTPLNCSIRVTVAYWNIITQIKHPIMSGQEANVQATLSQPDEIRRSRSDPNVYLFYKLQSEKRWLCAIARQLNGEGFLITTYPTDAIKEGETVWQK